jgi:hypothetical protein
MKMHHAFFVLLLLFTSCRSNSIVPEFWQSSTDCANLVVKGKGYLFEGRCGERIEIPKLKLKRSKSFSVLGSYFYYTQSGKSGSNLPVTLSGRVSDDGQKLDLNYTAPADSILVTYSLITQEVRSVCDCFYYFK